MTSKEYFMIEFDTDLTEHECKDIIKKESDKDKKEAETLIKVMEGKTGELSLLRRKVAGAILHNFQKLTLSEDKRQYLLDNFKKRVEMGSESFVSYKKGKIVVRFDEFSRMGSEMLNRTHNAEKNLMKRFKAKSMRYVKENSEEKT